jgi:hypothetical protein
MEDGGPPTITFMEFDFNSKMWRDVQGSPDKDMRSEIIGWTDLPKVPKNIPKHLLNPPVSEISYSPASLEEFERITYGQCKHGENMANCDICGNRSFLK